MRKKIIVIGILLMTLIIVLCLTWYNATIRLVNLNVQDVSEIVVFNGSTGKTLNISDNGDIEHILSNWNEVTLKKDNLSIGKKGYCFRVTIYLKNKQEASGWNDFIINSEDTVRKDPFFYKTTNVLIDYKYIENLFK